MRWFLGTAVLVASCTAACGDTATAPPDLTERTWRLASLDRNGQSVTVPSPDRYTIRFERDRLAVRSDCNSCGGSYSVAGTMLRVGPLACTRAFCGESSLDSEFSEALANATSISESNGALVIHSPGVTLRFIE